MTRMETPNLPLFIRTYTEEVWNKRDPSAISRYFRDTYVHHDVSRPDVRSLADYTQWARDLITAFPDIQVAIEDVFAEGDKAVKRWSASGTHRGPLAGIAASGKAVKFSGVTCYLVKEGKIAESWYIYDLFGLLRQLGALPPP